MNSTKDVKAALQPTSKPALFILDRINRYTPYQDTAETREKFARDEEEIVSYVENAMLTKRGRKEIKQLLIYYGTLEEELRTVIELKKQKILECSSKLPYSADFTKETIPFLFNRINGHSGPLYPNQPLPSLYKNPIANVLRAAHFDETHPAIVATCLSHAEHIDHRYLYLAKVIAASNLVRKIYGDQLFFRNVVLDILDAMNATAKTSKESANSETAPALVRDLQEHNLDYVLNHYINLGLAFAKSFLPAIQKLHKEMIEQISAINQKRARAHNRLNGINFSMAQVSQQDLSLSGNPTKNTNTEQRAQQLMQSSIMKTSSRDLRESNSSTPKIEPNTDELKQQIRQLETLRLALEKLLADREVFNDLIVKVFQRGKLLLLQSKDAIYYKEAITLCIKDAISKNFEYQSIDFVTEIFSSLAVLDEEYHHKIAMIAPVKKNGSITDIEIEFLHKKLGLLAVMQQSAAQAIQRKQSEVIEEDEIESMTEEHDHSSLSLNGLM